MDPRPWPEPAKASLSLRNPVAEKSGPKKRVVNSLGRISMSAQWLAGDRRRAATNHEPALDKRSGIGQLFGPMVTLPARNSPSVGSLFLFRSRYRSARDGYMHSVVTSEKTTFRFVEALRNSAPMLVFTRGLIG